MRVLYFYPLILSRFFFSSFSSTLFHLSLLFFLSILQHSDLQIQKFSNSSLRLRSYQMSAKMEARLVERLEKAVSRLEALSSSSRRRTFRRSISSRWYAFSPLRDLLIKAKLTHVIPIFEFFFRS